MSSHSRVFKQFSNFLVIFFLLLLMQNNISTALGSLELSLQLYKMLEADKGMAMKTINNLRKAEPEYFDGASNYLPDNDYYDDDINNEKRSSRIHVFRRGCIHRNGACDHRPNDCCFSSSCRCNLWGSNCRCQRMGLFQKWG